MKKRYLFQTLKLPAFTFIALILFSSSCTKPDIDFGADYLDNNYTNIVIVDTATSLLSTVFIDSFATSETGVAVAGKYTDPYFGEVAAQSYFSFIPPAFSDVYRNTTFDSLVLIIKPNGSYYGDTSVPINLQVHQLTEKIEFAENKTELYNHNTIPVDPSVLGFANVKVRPHATDSVSIRLSDTKGNELLNLFRNGDQAVKTSNAFINYFKGLNITTGVSSSMIIGFSDSVVMKLYYKEPGVVRVQKTIDFTLADKTRQFNNITINRAGTALSALGRANREILSSSSSNMAFTQTATGSVIKIQFPYLRDFLYNNKIVKIVRAELEIKPVKNSFNGLYPLPAQLRLSETTLENTFGADVGSIDASGAQQTDYGSLSIDNLYGENTSYFYNITTYINNQINATGNNRNGLLLSSPSPAFASEFNRVVLADKNNPNGKITLRLYYVSVQKPI